MRLINYIRARLRKYVNEEQWLDDHIKMGMKIGKGCSIQPGLIVDHSHCWLIEIGNYVTIAPQVYLLAHDASMKMDLDYTMIGKIKIEDETFIGARSVIMPGVTIGKGSIIASGSVVAKSVPPYSVYGGNPAKYIMTKDELINKHKERMKSCILYDESYTIHQGITAKKKKEMREELSGVNGYVK